MLSIKNKVFGMEHSMNFIRQVNFHTATSLLMAI